MRRWIPTLLLLLPLLLGAAAVDPKDEAGELALIESTVNDYLEGGTQHDRERVGRAFHESATLKFVRDGEFTVWTRDEYLSRIQPGPPSDRRTRILSMDYVGSCASAKVEADYGSFKFVDYLCLLKLDGRWLIVDKVFHRVNR